MENKTSTTRNTFMQQKHSMGGKNCYRIKLLNNHQSKAYFLWPQKIHRHTSHNKWHYLLRQRCLFFIGLFMDYFYDKISYLGVMSVECDGEMTV